MSSRSKLVHKVIDTRKNKAPFIHPNFRIDTRVDQKFKSRMDEFMKVALESVVMTNPDLPVKDRHGAALTYIYLKKEQFKLDLKEKKAQRARAMKKRMETIKAEELRAAMAVAAPAAAPASSSSEDSSSSSEESSDEESADN